MLITPQFSIKVDAKTELRLPETSDAAELFALVDKNRPHLREFLSWLDKTKEVKDSLHFIELERANAFKHLSLHLLIIHENKIVGAIALLRFDLHNRWAEIGYWIDHECQRKGIMTKSVKTLIDYCFNEFHFHRVELRCATKNTKSQKIPKKLGFTFEGVLKEVFTHYGTYFDANIYGLINPNSLPAHPSQRGAKHSFESKHKQEQSESN